MWLWTYVKKYGSNFMERFANVKSVKYWSFQVFFFNLQRKFHEFSFLFFSHYLNKLHPWFKGQKIFWQVLEFWRYHRTDNAKSSSTVSKKPLGQTLWYRWHCWGGLCDIIDTAEEDSVILLTPLRQTLWYH